MIGAFAIFSTSSNLVVQSLLIERGSCRRAVFEGSCRVDSFGLKGVVLSSSFGLVLFREGVSKDVEASGYRMFDGLTCVVHISRVVVVWGLCKKDSSCFGDSRKAHTALLFGEFSDGW